MEAERSVKDAQFARGRQVYFLEAVGTDLVKVGFANNIDRRMVGHLTSSAVPLRLIGIIPGGHEKEREVHAILAPFRSHGEWFVRSALMDELIEAAGNRLKEARLLRHKDTYLFAHIRENFVRKPTVKAGIDAAALV